MVNQDWREQIIRASTAGDINTQAIVTFSDAQLKLVSVAAKKHGLSRMKFMQFAILSWVANELDLEWDEIIALAPKGDWSQAKKWPIPS